MYSPAYDSALATGITLTSIMLYFKNLQGKAQYGRFGGKTSGMSLDPRFGWWLMEVSVECRPCVVFKTKF